METPAVASEEDHDHITVEGEEIALDELKFVQIEGTQLTVYLPEKYDTFQTPQGEKVAMQVAGGTVKFQHGIYPTGDDTISYGNAKMLVNHDHYGELFKVARSAFDVPTAEEVREAREESMAENEVFVDGQVMKKSEALEYIQGQQAETEAEQAPSEFEGEPDTVEGHTEMKPLDASNKQEALEMLAQQGLTMEDAPSASDSTAKIQAFAMNHGFVIPKYDLPDTQ